MDVILRGTKDVSDIELFTPFTQWFLIVLYLVEVIMVFIKNANEYILSAIAIFVISIFLLFDWNDITYPQQILCATFFCLLGYIMKPLIEKIKLGSNLFFLCGFIGLLIVCYLSTLNKPVGMYINQNGNKTFFLFIALLGILSTFFISKSLSTSKFLKFVGINSIYYFVLHFSLIKLVSPVIRHFHVNAYNLYHITVFIIVTIVCTLLTKYFRIYAPFFREKINGNLHFKQ